MGDRGYGINGRKENMRKRTYTKAERKRKAKWHKQYNHRHDYTTYETANKKFTWTEMYLIWNKRLKGGRILTDVEIAKILQRSLQSVQLKRHKMRVSGGI
jgi:hypothetical protein